MSNHLQQPRYWGLRKTWEGGALHPQYKHGLRHTPEYEAWKHLRRRCDCPKDNSYHNYGGRGITYTKRWRSFQNFIEDMGFRPSADYSIDRINVNGNYCKANCRWATRQEQAVTRRCCIRVTVDGVTFQTLTEAATAYGISTGTVWFRLKIGWSMDDALKRKVRGA